MKRGIIERLLSVIRRPILEEFAGEAGIDKPWHLSRKELEQQVYQRMPEKELREALLDHLKSIL